MSAHSTEELFAVHESRAKDLPIEERLDAFDEYAEMLTYAIFDVGEVLHDVIDARKPIDTLYELISQRTVADLRNLLAKAGVRQVPRGPKRRVVEMVLDTCHNDDPYAYLGLAIPSGEDYLHQVRDLLAEGGHHAFAKAGVKRANDIMQPMFPLVAYYETADAYVAFIPLEIRTLLADLDDEDWDAHYEQARVVDELRNRVVAAADLRGIVPLDEMINEYLADHPGAIDRGILQLILSSDEWLVGEPVDAVYNDKDGSSFLLARSFTDMVQQDNGQLDGDLIDGLLEDQTRLPPRQMTDELPVGTTILRSVLRSAEGHELLAFLDARVPEGYDDESFALSVVCDLVQDLRETDDYSCLDGNLEHLGLRAIGGFAEELYALVERLNLVVPKWRLNGWSYAELQERAEDGDGTDGLLPNIKPKPARLRDFSKDEASGFIWADEQDDLPPFNTPHGDNPFDFYETFMQMFTSHMDDDLEFMESAMPEATADAANRQLDFGFGGLDEKDALAEAKDEADAPTLVREEPSSAAAPYIDVDDAEADLDKLREDAEHHLDEFEEWLKGTGLKPKTISRHVNNLYDFLVYYLAEYEGMSMEEGIYSVGGYLGEFFIRKMMWSTPATIRTTAASIKKFYKCMQELGHVSVSDRDLVSHTIKEDLPKWCALCEQYNDPYGENPFIPW